MMSGRQWVRRIRWKRVITAVLALYVLGLILVCMFPDRVVLFPSRSPIRVEGTTREFVEAPTGKVEIWITRTSAASQGGPEAFVLAFNGNGSRAERELGRIAPMWEEHAVEIWAVNYSGYGGSAGSAVMKNIPPAALAAYDALAQRASGKPIFVSGHSIGTAAALYVGASRPVAGLVLHNPPPLRELIMGRFGWFNLWIAATRVKSAVPDEMDSLANAHHCSAPAVFILAGGDTLVLPKYQQMIVDSYAGPKRLVHISSYAHNTPVAIPELQKVRPQIDWLWAKAPAKH